VGDASRSLAILEDIIEHALSHLHTVQKSLLFWRSRAEVNKQFNSDTWHVRNF
jgi:hypothetical protein